MNIQTCDFPFINNLLSASDCGCGQSPTGQFSGSAKLADNPEVQAVMGDLADTFIRREGWCELHPARKLQAAPKTWQEKGLSDLRDLVRQGLASAAVLKFFAGRPASCFAMRPGNVNAIDILALSSSSAKRNLGLPSLLMSVLCVMILLRLFSNIFIPPASWA